MKTVLFENALFHTGLSETDACPYLLVKGGRIIALSHERPEKYDECVDLGGGHAYPCLIDAHTHLLYTIVMGANGFDICCFEDGRVTPDTLAGVEARLRQYAATKGKNDCVAANGYIVSAIREGRFPGREELDNWCGGRPTVVYSIDGHASALSSAMLQKIGIDPEGHSGVLMGEAHESVQGRINDVISADVTPAVLARGIAKLENDCAAWGISHVGALEGFGSDGIDKTAELMLQLAQRMRLQVRMYFQYFNVDLVEKYRKYLKKPRLGGCGSWEMDGACGAHSAAFREPYPDTGEVAPCYYTQEQVDAAVAKADALGYQIACHAIGDAAVERITSALMRTKPSRFHRVEHGEFFDDTAFERYKSGRFAVVMQPGYAWIDKRFLHSYERFLPEKARASLRFGSLYRAGVCVCGSSDAPVQSMDPWLQMQGMCEFYHEEESVTPYEAFRCYTVNAARALEEEDEIGTLEAGKEANFFVADEDLFRIDPHKVADFRPRATYYGGKLYKKRSGSLRELLGMLLRKPHKV